MRRSLFIVLLSGVALFAKADHITGGQMYYVYLGGSNGMHNYRVTLMLYMRCNSGREFPNPGFVSVFERGSNTRLQDLQVSLTKQETISLTESNPCITDPPRVCYVVGTYVFDVALEANENGYILSSQVNFRIAGINNLYSGYSQIGATYTTEIPGTKSVANGPQNVSAKFIGSDLVVVCAKNPFNYSFAAEDDDGDELRYSFCDAYIAQGGGRGADGAPASPPPYQAVPYGTPFTAYAPLGDRVKIDPQTGLITGIAPEEGIYVVTVCVEEVRGGVIIARQRKDLQINIANCKIAAAALLPDYLLCGDSKSIVLSNLSTSPLITSYNWEFFNDKGISIFNSQVANAAYTFPDTGTYKLKLVINRNGPCSDSFISNAKVYPGFVPSFDFNGICIKKPTSFRDATTSVYGVVNSWEWDFGDPFAGDDFSDLPNDSYTYGTTGVKNVVLTATDTKGCRATFTKQVTIVDKPPIRLAFSDTLICITDNVQLNAAGSGVFSWTPALGIQNANTATPTVSPSATTTYYVHLDENGCLNDDSVKVNVVDHVTLQAMRDTVICSGDEIQLRVQSDGLQYTWAPAAQMDNALIANPLAVTPVTTNYIVTARIGSCSASDDVRVSTVAYPVAAAGADVMICYNASVQLQGVSDGRIYQWTPAATLNNASVLNPVASPGVEGPVQYVLYAYDTKGCPKPGIDTVTVTVLPDMNAYAGRDTSVVIGQPLQLNATGGVQYSWLPATGLSNYSVPNPIGVYNAPSSGIRYKVLVYNEANCVDSAYITVKVFATRPTVFVPTAFTPNSDGKNDRLRPIAAGIKSIEYFNVYNRWGQLVFSGQNEQQSWDGTIGGRVQATGTFVWIVKAVDYNGDPYFQRGTTTLIR